MQRLSPTSLSQYIKLDNCDRFLRFRLKPEDEERLLKRWGLTIQPLTPLLKEAGSDFEVGVVERLKASGQAVVDLSGVNDPQRTLQEIAGARRVTYLLQPRLEAPLGDFLCGGQADVVRVAPQRSGPPQLLIVDIKASRVERTDHRLQVAVYAHLLQQMLQGAGLGESKVSGAILTAPEGGSLVEDGLPFDDLAPFDLDTYLSILERMALRPDSTVQRILAQPFEQVFYHLGYKCDGCLYNALCMYSAAENLDLALTPHISAVEKRVLLESGVRTVPELAGLMALPVEKGVRELVPLQPERVDELRSRWPLGANLPLLVQRARALMNAYDRKTPALRYILGAGFGTLPSDDEHPNLVKVFFDAQRDYLTDRVYLISGLVKGPAGEGLVVKVSQGPPDIEEEGQLLREWVEEVLSLLPRVSRAPQAPVHLYAYNRYDQKVLLEALKRHLSLVVSLPAFFDLMTQSPALSQPVISFLAEEIQERTNLGQTCSPLHNTASALGFDWHDGQYAHYELFRARMFDNRRYVTRLPGGRLGRTEADPESLDIFRIETASRFNSQIPLEYAYAAWGSLPGDPADPRLLEPFRRVSLEHLCAFAAHRVRALAHIENVFKVKARFLNKEALDLTRLQAAPAQTGLALSLNEFLHLEHHAALQEKLLTYGLPIERRATTGLAMLLKCLSSGGESAVFAPQFAELGLEPEQGLNACRLKEGDWVVLNPASAANGRAPSANQIKHGRLAIIQSISRDQVVLAVRSLFGKGRFRYFHNNDLKPAVGELYTIDEMADDMNSDKVLDALNHVDGNIFYEWLLERPAPRADLAPDPSFLEGFVDGVDALLKPKRIRLTQPQRAVIAGSSAEPLVLVQGPPGTGKSYTLAWAILAQSALRASRGLPCRIAVACKTHNAVNVALKALAEARQLLAAFPVPQLGGRDTAAMQIFKLVNDQTDPVPSGVLPFDAYNRRSEISRLLVHPQVVFGGTSGGLYSLIKYHPAGGKEVDWSLKHFDVLVIDEASQMSLPEGVLSAAFLKPQGKMIVVGDHRQMPPIIAHNWKEEHRRSLAETRPYVSLFESLLERGFPRTALDRSFRLHREIAEFLNQNIYSRDGIHFYSRREELLHNLPRIDDYTDKVLDPRYPIVVIEHTESASQQFNRLELALARPLIEACVRHLSLDGRTGLGIVVPHRAQKALLKGEFPALAEVNSIDTVERFQGDERDVIIVSATASDPDFVRSEADFLLNLNRLNVAISRPKKKLIVIASRSVIDLLTSDLEVFENAVIWKRLYYHYTPAVLHEQNIDGHQVFVRGRIAGA